MLYSLNSSLTASCRAWRPNGMWMSTTETAPTCLTYVITPTSCYSIKPRKQSQYTPNT
jgi:hypothetical protein